MLILALDTATDAVGAAVLDTEGDRVVGRASFDGPAAHGEQLAPMVAAALAQAGARPSDLAAIGVGRGPGPYTGLRVGLVHAEVLGWALGIPVHGVCSLDVLAADVLASDRLAGSDDEAFLVVTDARRREVYWACYGLDRERLEGPAVDRPGDVPGTALLAVGAGARRYPDRFARRSDPQAPDPGVLARMVAVRLAEDRPPEVSPLYLRRPDTTAGGTRKRVTPR